MAERGRDFWPLPETPVLFAVAAAARGGGLAAAVAAVRSSGARRLDRRAQWVVYQCLGDWRGAGNAGRFGADRVVAAVVAEWARLGLAVSDPDDDDE